MTDQVEMKQAFDTIAERLDQGIVEFESRPEINQLCRSLGMSLTDFADGLHDEMIYSLLRGDAEVELVYTYMPGEAGYDHRYDLTEKWCGETIRDRKWVLPSAYEMQMTDLSTTRLS